MNPEIMRMLAAQHEAELRTEMARARRGAGRLRALWRRGPAPAAGRGIAPARSAGAGLPGARQTPVAGPVFAAGDGGAPPGVFLAEAEAFGVRAYLTSAEARQLAAEWSQRLAGFADRLDEPRRRPPGALPFEVVILGAAPPAEQPSRLP